MKRPQKGIIRLQDRPRKKPVATESIPGLTEAVAAAREREYTLRELAFLEVPVEIHGVLCEQYRPRHRLLLTAAGNPFSCGGEVRAEDIALFLWVVRADRALTDRDAFAAALPDVPERAIEQYLADAELDKPASGGGRSEPIATLWASLAHEFAYAYGWSVAQTMETPFAQLYQLFRFIQIEDALRAKRKPPVFTNRLSGKAEKEAIEAHLAAQAP